jgi:hypothetical protein
MNFSHNDRCSHTDLSCCNTTIEGNGFVNLHIFFTSALNAPYWPGTRFGCLSPGKETGKCKPWTTRTGSEKNFCPLLEQYLVSFSSISYPSHHTGWDVSRCIINITSYYTTLLTKSVNYTVHNKAQTTFHPTHFGIY